MDAEGGTGAGIYRRGIHTEEAEAAVEEEAQRGIGESGPRIGEGAGGDRAAAAEEESFDGARREGSEVAGLDERARWIYSENQGASEKRLEREVV